MYVSSPCIFLSQDYDSCLHTANLLPPPNGLQLPIVKLMNHPTYHRYQAHVAALSLFPNLYVKFLPPNWGASVPQSTPTHGLVQSPQEPENKSAAEWKRRIRMYSCVFHWPHPIFYLVLLVSFGSWTYTRSVRIRAHYLWHFPC
jgi:hypothetical protein